MGLIDANKLMEKYTHPNELIYTFSIIDDIKNAPTVDAVPVVRCKDCKFNISGNKCLYPDSIIKIPDDNDFCSYGKRKEKNFTR